MAEIVVADTGPLIALSRIGRIDLLGRVFERAVVPRVVFDETQFHSDRADARAIFSGLELGLFVVDETPVQPQAFPDGDKRGPGETAAIALAASHGYGVLIDEKLGRSVASAIGLRVIGTVGVLVIARKLGYVPALNRCCNYLHHLATTFQWGCLKARFETQASNASSGSSLARS